VVGPFYALRVGPSYALSSSARVHRHMFPLSPSNRVDRHDRKQHSPLFESDAGGMSLWRLE
jgi:hypothetical protein